jgi:hypothetical protein
VAEAAARAVSARGAQATLAVPGGVQVSASWGWWPAMSRTASSRCGLRVAR